jgi:hypothetical protein
MLGSIHTLIGFLSADLSPALIPLIITGFHSIAGNRPRGFGDFLV